MDPLALFDPSLFIRDESNSLCNSLFQSLICSICYHLLDQACGCLNGHVFCRKCLKKARADKPNCPMCKVSLEDMDDTISVPSADLMVANLKVKCLHHDACTWTGDFGPRGVYLEQHIVHHCNEHPIKCDNIGCPQSVPRKNK